MRKALLNSPSKSQTGPAIRGDEATMKRHLLAMAEHPSWQDLYEKMSEDIQDFYYKKSE